MLLQKKSGLEKKRATPVEGTEGHPRDELGPHFGDGNAAQANAEESKVPEQGQPHEQANPDGMD
jgi:hypothetical protein